MKLSAVIEDISTNRMPGPCEIIYGYLLDEGGIQYRYCLERDIHGWYFGEKTEIPDDQSMKEMEKLILDKALPILRAMEN